MVLRTRAFRSGRGSPPRSPPSAPSRGARRRRGRPATTSLSSTSKPMSARATSFSTIRSTPLRSRLARARSRPSPVSAAKPTSTWPGRRAAPMAARMSVVGTSSSDQSPAARPLRVAGVGRPVVGDGGGHQHDVGVGGAGERLALQVGGGRRLDDGAAGRAHGGVAEQRRHLGAAQQRRVGERDAHAAARAVAEEAHRVERLARAAGRDQHAAARRADRPGRSSAATAAWMSPGGARRPAPVSPSASSPCSGPTITAPRAPQQLDGGLRGRVLPHAHVHRRRDDEAAGQRQRRLGQHVVGQARARAWRACSPSTARPPSPAPRGPRRGAGRSGRPASARSVSTGVRERPAKVVSPTKRSAAGVITTWTARPSFTSRRHSSAAR